MYIWDMCTLVQAVQAPDTATRWGCVTGRRKSARIRQVLCVLADDDTGSAGSHSGRASHTAEANNRVIRHRVVVQLTLAQSTKQSFLHDASIQARISKQVN